MLVFAALITVTLSRRIILKGILFMTAGLVSIIIVNAIRITLLFVSVAEKGLVEEAMRLKRHDVYNYFTYLYVVGLVALWLKLKRQWNVKT